MENSATYRKSALERKRLLKIKMWSWILPGVFGLLLIVVPYILFSYLDFELDDPRLSIVVIIMYVYLGVAGGIL